MNASLWFKIRSALVLTAVLTVLALAQTHASTTSVSPDSEQLKGGPNHAILYKRAVTLLDNAEKKLNARYTSEAAILLKESNSLFAILQKELATEQRQRLLNPKEEQQEAINQKLFSDECMAAERLMKSAEDREKKSTEIEASQPEQSLKLQQEAREEYEQAHKRYIKAKIYVLRNQQMLFRFLTP